MNCNYFFWSLFFSSCFVNFCNQTLAVLSELFIFTIVENKILLSNVECYKIQILDLIVFVPKETQIFNGESFTKINLKSDKFYFNGQIINNFKITDEIANILH